MTVVLAAFPAALWAVALWGRTAPAGVSLRWALTFGVATAAISWWTARPTAGNREAPLAWRLWSGGVGLLPAAAFAALVLARLYASNEAYHAWVFFPTAKGLVLPVSIFLAWLAPAFGVAWRRTHGGGGRRRGFDAVVTWLAARRDALALLTLVGVGWLHALSYSAVATDDLIRYWAIADAWSAGAPYAVTEGAPGTGEFYLVDLPFYPMLIQIAFGLFGHRYFALHVPLVLANSALPALLYATARATGATRLIALALALVVVLFPPYQVYALGSAEPDPLWAALLAVQVWLALRCARQEDEPLRSWVALGAISALLVLTRPEGVLYTAPLFLGLAWYRRRELWIAIRRRDRGSLPAGILVAGITLAIPVLAFSTFLLWTFGIVWPTGWGSVAGVQYVPTNVRLILQQNLPHYAATAGLPVPAITGPFVALLLIAWVIAGYAILWRRIPALRIWPVPVLLNLAVILLSPTYLAADHLSPPTFFRHFAIAIPWLMPALAAPFATARGRPQERGAASPRQPARRRGMRETALAGIFAALIAGQAAVVGDAALRTHARKPSVLTSDPYVLVTDLWQADDALPSLPFVDGPGRGVSIDTSFPYMAFRARLFEAMQPYNLHVNDAGRAYTLATAITAFAGLASLTIATHGRRRLSAADDSAAPAGVPGAVGPA